MSEAWALSICAWNESCRLATSLCVRGQKEKEKKGAPHEPRALAATPEAGRVRFLDALERVAKAGKGLEGLGHVHGLVLQRVDRAVGHPKEVISDRG